MSTPDDLADLATSVSDGGALDWNEVHRTHGTADPAILRELSVIASIAQAQRRIAAESADPGPQSWGGIEIREELGAGAFGNVYRAWDPALQRHVALKIYRERPDQFGSTLSSLLTEGRLLARVKHPNVAIVHGVEQRGDEVGLWMELIDGRTLAEEVQTGGPMGFREAAIIAQDLCRALAAVHLLGVVHRDVKPQNVMRERGGRIVLMDFGVGRDLRARSAGPETSGTPLYMAPELFSGAPASVAADLYSLGVLLFHLVTGSYPVTASSRAELERAHQQGRRHLLRDVRPDLPDAFVQVVERACAVDPAARFATAGAMEAALAGAVGVSASATTEPTRRPLLSRMLVVLPMAATIVAAIALYKSMGGGSRGPASGPGGGPVAAGATLAPQYTIDAAFFRKAGSGGERLTAAGRVRLRDELFIEMQSTLPVHVYIVNQDERGEAYLLFPLPGQSVTNPLSPNTKHRLPSADATWQVTSEGGREHFLIVASPEPMAPLETMLAALPKAAPGRPVSSAAVPGEVMGQLRGIGRLNDGAGARGASRDLITSAAMLSGGPESTSGAWMRRFTLDNPKRD